MFSSKFAYALVFVSAFSKLATVSFGAPIPVRRSGSSKTLTARAGYTGDGTYYDTGLGACGVTNVNTDFIAAMAYQTFDSYPGATANPNNNPICNQVVVATYEGKSVTVTITDRCAGCKGEYDLDFSPSAFSQLADQSIGRLTGVTWNYGSSSSTSSASSSSSSDSSSSSSSSTVSSSSSSSSAGSSSSSTSSTDSSSSPAASSSGSRTCPDVT